MKYICGLLACGFEVNCKNEMPLKISYYIELAYAYSVEWAK